MRVLELESQMFTDADAGCWYDSHRGWTINAAIIRDAIDRGFTLDDDADRAWIEYDDTDTSKYHDEWENFWQDRDDFYDVADEAERFLANLAPEGYWIGFNDGDFGMYAIDAEGEDF